MKQGLLIAALFIFVSIVGWQKGKEPAKKYTVTLPLDQWQATLQVLDSAQKSIVASDMPVRSASWINIRIATIIQIIQSQVGGQIQEEQAKEKADSSKSKSPKK